MECYLWNTEFLTYGLFLSSTWNIVILTVERFLSSFCFNFVNFLLDEESKTYALRPGQMSSNIGSWCFYKKITHTLKACKKLNMCCNQKWMIHVINLCLVSLHWCLGLISFQVTGKVAIKKISFMNSPFYRTPVSGFCRIGTPACVLHRLWAMD